MMRRFVAREDAGHLGSAPVRSTNTVSGEPAMVIVRRKPSPMESTPTSTATTPAMPKTAAAAEPLRAGSVRRLKPISAAICRERSFIYSLRERVDGVEAHGLQRGQQAGDEAEQDDEDDAEDAIAHGGRMNTGSAPPVGSPRDTARYPRRGRCRRRRRRSAATRRARARAPGVGEADRLQHAQLAHPLAHRLGHGVAGDEQDGEEHGGEDGRSRSRRCCRPARRSP